MAVFDTTRSQFATAGFIGRIGLKFASLYGVIAAWNDERATRNALSKLTDRELDDIGMCRGDIDLVARPR